MINQYSEHDLFLSKHNSKSNLAKTLIDNKSTNSISKNSFISAQTAFDEFVKSESAKTNINYHRYVDKNELKKALQITKNKKITKKPKNNTKKT